MKQMVNDQLGRQLHITQSPQRIISLVPSQTELLADLGLEKEVVGITKFCVHPSHWRKQKTLVGGTKQLHFDRVQKLNPDLIIANKEENDKEMVEQLEKDYPVWVSDVHDLASVLEMIKDIGAITNRREKAFEIKEQVAQLFKELQDLQTQKQRPTVAYFIWHKPLMVAGGDTFINAMLEEAGYDNVFGQMNRYPSITEQQLVDADPDLIFLSSEPFPFKAKHIDEYQKICRRAVLRLVDGESFSWYGSRLLQAPAYFRNLRAELAI